MYGGRYLLPGPTKETVTEPGGTGEWRILWTIWRMLLEFGESGLFPRNKSGVENNVRR
jgi:hypothetical protein